MIKDIKVTKVILSRITKPWNSPTRVYAFLFKNSLCTTSFVEQELEEWWSNLRVFAQRDHNFIWKFFFMKNIAQCWMVLKFCPFDSRLLILFGNMGMNPFNHDTMKRIWKYVFFDNCHLHLGCGSWQYQNRGHDIFY